VPPGNRLEKLAGDRAGHYSIRINQLAKEIGVSARRVNEIVHGQRRISADTALRLARFFGTSERFWINLQSRYDLEMEKDRLGDALDGIRPLTAAS
jgi:antitoxin HigA-1